MPRGTKTSKSVARRLAVQTRSRDAAARPTANQLNEWAERGGCEATDGCWVEVDGTCPHGCPSWVVEMGLI